MTPLHRAAFLVILLGCVTAVTADARHLSMRRYNVADGLAHDQVTSLLEDSRGYLWIGTFEGLSRFDGYAFVSYDTAAGLGNYVINDLAEDSKGRLWVATNGGGLSVLDDAPGVEKRFSSFIPGEGGSENVNVAVLDAAGRLWCGTDDGVYVADISGAVPVFTRAGFQRASVIAAAAQSDRTWMGVDGVGLVEFRNGGATVHPVPWVERAPFRRIVPDGPGAVLVASDAGLFRFVKGEWETVPVDLGPQQIIYDLLSDGTGGIWLATSEGLLRYTARDTRRYSLDTARGGQLSAILIDRGGNLWMGLGRNGVGQIRPEQIHSYTAAEGLPDIDVTAMFEDGFGHVFGLTRRRKLAIVKTEGVATVNEAILTNRPLAEGRGSWWGLVQDGVYRIRGPFPQFDRPTRLPLNVTPAVPLPSSTALTAVDGQGRLWFGSVDRSLYRISEPDSAKPVVDRWPIDLPNGGIAGVLGIDRQGGVWLANMVSLARFADGKLTIIDTPAGLASLQPRAFMVDRQGNVWIGLRFGGVMMTREPSAARPHFVRHSVADGLASDTVWALAEDHQGLIYLGTGRGLDQLDPVSRQVRHFNTDDGLAGNVVNHLNVDRSGTVWVASMGGISRLDLGFAPVRRAPVPIYISRVLLAGVSHALPGRGATRVGDLQLRANERNLRIDFVSPRFQHSGRMRYQYWLEGVDTHWSAPAAERMVTYATLAPGRYRFHVRAVTADGCISEEPAVVDFVIHPHVWSRPWFIATMFVGVLAGAVGVQRLREHRRRAMAAIRRQVATDLHDDVGSGLSQIAILSEVAKRKAGSDALAPLNEVADLARALRDSMSDIVWAVDPARDVPVALIERMRQVTFNLLSLTTDVAFHAPGGRELAQLDLTPDRRRHLLLIFKEAITNIARHAHATRVSIEVMVESRRLRLTICDNGAGFDMASHHEGHGLDNLVSRAQAIDARIEIHSRPGEGTRMSLLVPLRRRTRIFRWLPFVDPRS